MYVADLYTTAVHTDFLDFAVPQDVAVIVGNPPYHLGMKEKFRDRVVLLGIPCLFLLPSECLQKSGWREHMETVPIRFYPLCPPPHYIYEGNLKHIGVTGWFAWNFSGMELREDGYFLTKPLYTTGLKPTHVEGGSIEYCGAFIGVSLFSGCGGGTLGMHRAGVEVVAFSETACDSHLKNFSHCELLEGIYIFITINNTA